MTGMVLCGGQSSRMGHDKGMLQHDSVSWVQLAADKIATLSLPVVVSVNEKQYSLYSATIKNIELVEDNTALKIGGPLKGILSVHSKKQDDLLVLACDMPSMQPEVLQHLITVSKNKNDDAFVFHHNHSAEPLCGVYTAKGLKKILQLYEQGCLKRFSMQYVLTLLNTLYLPMPPEWEKGFRNYNSPEDLHHL